MDKLCSTEKDISEYIIEKKDAEYKEYSVTEEVPSYFNRFECGRNILDRLDVTYEGVCMATQKKMETIVNDKNRNGALLSNKKLRQEVSKVME